MFHEGSSIGQKVIKGSRHMDMPIFLNKIRDVSKNAHAYKKYNT
jgi:hypothetical protein